MALPTCGTATLGDVVRRRRREHGLDQDELGQRVGLDFWTIKQIERGNDVPTGATLRALAQTLDLDVDVLLEAPITETPAAALPRPETTFSVTPRPVTDFGPRHGLTDRVIDERPVTIPAPVRLRTHLVRGPLSLLEEKVNAALLRIESHRISAPALPGRPTHGLVLSVTHHDGSQGSWVAILYRADVDLFAVTDPSVR